MSLPSFEDPFGLLAVGACGDVAFLSALVFWASRFGFETALFLDWGLCFIPGSSVEFGLG